MIHDKRKFGVALESDPAVLASKLQGQTWTACSAFRIGRYIFANDSFSEDGAQEYAVLADFGHEELAQIESITFGWCDPAKALFYVENVLAGLYDDAASRNPVNVSRDQIEPKHGTCGACA